MTSIETAPIAVELLRYDKPRKAWGLHIIRPIAKPDFLNRFDWVSAKLYSDSNLVADSLQENDLQECLNLDQVKPDLRRFICNQVVPMEWIDLLMGPDCEEKTSCEARITVWFTPGDSELYAK